MSRSRLAVTLSRRVTFILLLAAALLCSDFPADNYHRLSQSHAPLSLEEADEWQRPSEWFYAQRAYPLRNIPPAARQHALEQLEREEQRMRDERAASAPEAAALNAAALPAWTPLGPAPIGQGQTFGNPRVAVSGRVSTIIPDPGYNGTTNQTVYLGAAQGGVWRSRDGGATWTPMTDDQPSLAMGALAIDPTNPNIIYAGTGEGHRSADSYYGAGLLKSADGGATWTLITGPVSAAEPRLPAFQNAAIAQIVIDPAAPATLFLCTTFGNTAGASGGSGQAPLGQAGLWKSTDGGMNWRNVDPGGTNGMFSAHDVLIDPLNHNRVFAAMRTIGLYRSAAGGEPGTWERLAGGLPDPTDNTSNSPFRRIALAAGPPVAPSTNATIYAAYAGRDDNLLGIFRSTDGGTTWTKVNSPQTQGQANYNLALATDPGDSSVVYYGTQVNNVNTGGTLWRSRDGGQTWTDLSAGNGASGGLHADTHWIAVSPANRNVLFTANDGGVWRTDNATADTVAWTSLNRSLNLTQFQSVALHPTDPNLLIGGTQDNGTNRYNGQPEWFQARGGDGGFALIDQSNPQVIYHTFFNQNNENSQRPQIGLEVSFNGGTTWTRRGCFNCTAAQGNFNPADRVSFYAPMAQHTGFTGANGNVIYFGTHRLYRSADQGATWTGLGASADSFGADLTKGSGFTAVITAIAAHPLLAQNTNPPGELVWIGTGDGLVQLTTNAGALSGASFTNVTKAPLPNRFITDIALDAGDQKRAFVTYSGFNSATPATPGHVFMTADQGATWTDISGNLPDVPVTSIAPDPALKNKFYIGTDLGVFQTSDGGATWVRLGDGMPKVAVFMLRYHAASRSLIAATHGRGMYRLPLPAGAQTSVSAASYNRSGLAAESIAAAFGSNLATTTEAAAGLPLPTELAGTRVLVRDSAGVERLAPLFFVSPQQINYQLPPGTAAGTAVITITSGDGTVSSGTEQIATVAPGLFAANSDGQGVAAAYAVRVRNGTQTVEQVFEFSDAQKKFVFKPLDLGPAGDTVVLVLFGTGIRGRSAQSAVSCQIGGANAEVQYASVAPGFIGLDQVNAVIPRSLTGRGEVDVALTADGRASNAVRISLR
ncbi:MAG TPA: hypothetical protein VNQ79_05475 [Blastocatellia bacterium]|nr:hypothetical protein [Blastocatellia bacterium]